MFIGRPDKPELLRLRTWHSVRCLSVMRATVSSSPSSETAYALFAAALSRNAAESAVPLKPRQSVVVTWWDQRGERGHRGSGGCSQLNCVRSRRVYYHG